MCNISFKEKADKNKTIYFNELKFLLCSTKMERKLLMQTLWQLFLHLIRE